MQSSWAVDKSLPLGEGGTAKAVPDEGLHRQLSCFVQIWRKIDPHQSPFGDSFPQGKPLRQFLIKNCATYVCKLRGLPQGSPLFCLLVLL